MYQGNPAACEALSIHSRANESNVLEAVIPIEVSTGLLGRFSLENTALPVKISSENEDFLRFQVFSPVVDVPHVSSLSFSFKLVLFACKLTLGGLKS